MEIRGGKIYGAPKSYSNLIVEETESLPVPKQGDIVDKDSVNTPIPETEIHFMDKNGEQRTLSSKWFTPEYQGKIKKVVRERYGTRQVSLKVLCEIAAELEDKEGDEEVASWFGLP